MAVVHIGRVSLVNQPDSKDAEYFDSFGVQPSDVVVLKCVILFWNAQRDGL